MIHAIKHAMKSTSTHLFSLRTLLRYVASLTLPLTLAMFFSSALLLSSGCSAKKSPVITPVALTKNPAREARKDKWLAKPMFGAYLSRKKGSVFEPVIALDPRDAIIYIYRPANRWGKQEVQAPNFYVNDTAVFGLRSGDYSWIELPAGQYNITARRPFMAINLKEIFELPITVEGGQTYFLRYSETEPLDLSTLSSKDEDFVEVESLQYVPQRIGAYDIANTQLKTQGVFFGAYDSQRWAAFHSFGKTGQGVTQRGADVYDSDSVKGLGFFGRMWQGIKRIF